MSNEGRSEGFHMLDDFVSEAILGPDIPLAEQQHPGRNEGISVLEELSFEIRGEQSESEKLNGGKSPRPSALDEAIKSEAGRLAAFIAAAGNPHDALASFQELLAAELNVIQKNGGGAAQTVQGQ